MLARLEKIKYQGRRGHLIASGVYPVPILSAISSHGIRAGREGARNSITVMRRRERSASVQCGMMVCWSLLGEG